MQCFTIGSSQSLKPKNKLSKTESFCLWPLLLEHRRIRDHWLGNLGSIMKLAERETKQKGENIWQHHVVSFCIRPHATWILKWFSQIFSHLTVTRYRQRRILSVEFYQTLWPFKLINIQYIRMLKKEKKFNAQVLIK